MKYSSRERLLSRLVGIARATDGNEHLINAGATAAILEGLCLLEAGEEQERLRLYDALLEEKRKMIPNCFLCANPCGKNDDLDLRELSGEDPQILAMKQDLLGCARSLAYQIRGASISKDTERLLYDSLIAFGIMGIDMAQLRELSMDLRRICDGIS